MDIFQTFIFQNLTNEELEEMKNLHFLRNSSFEKNTLIFQTGDRIHEIGMVLKGSVHIESIDLWGNRSILSHVPEGHAFAETYALCHEPMMVDAVSTQESEIAFLDTDILLNDRYLQKSWYAKIMHNLLIIFSGKIWFFPTGSSVPVPKPSVSVCSPTFRIFPSKPEAGPFRYHSTASRWPII